MNFLAVIFILFSIVPQTECQDLVGITENSCSVEELRSEIQELRIKNEVLTRKLNKLQEVLDFFGYGYISKYQDMVYLVPRNRLPWDKALKFCRQLNSVLADISDQKQNDFIKDLAKLFDEDIWIGGYRFQNEWYWKTATGKKSVNYTAWSPGEPNNERREQDCIQLWKKKSFSWDDDFCNVRKAFLCSKII